MAYKKILGVLLIGLILIIGCTNTAPTESETKAESVKETKTESSINIDDGTIHEIEIADLFGSPEKYGGKMIQVSGECTKVNLAIMGRNWIHLKDGSQDDFDFVITSSEEVEVGANVTMKGKVTLNKDFGAGYKYDIIVENGDLVK